jgi:hypothetical protein
MRLDFNVLWVDDQPVLVDAQIKSIAHRMEEEGFQFNPRLCQSLGDVRKLVTEEVFTDEVDLILVDWDLGGGAHGEDAIAVIRDEVRYKDVVFYSALKPADELRKVASDNGLEGIYCANREGLVDEVMGVFESLVKKVLDLDHTRGIVMGATSDIDHMVNECLVSIHGALDGTGKDTMLKEARGYVARRIEQLTEAAKQLEAATTIGEFFEAHMVLTAFDRLRILADALKVPALAAHGSFRASVVSYQQTVVPGRNKLGHLVLQPQGKPEAVVDSEGKQVSLEEMRKLRKLILGLRNDFRNLQSALKSAG